VYWLLFQFYDFVLSIYPNGKEGIPLYSESFFVRTFTVVLMFVQKFTCHIRDIQGVYKFNKTRRFGSRLCFRLHIKKAPVLVEPLD